VLVPVAWDWVEPEEGKFDFSVLDRVLAGARKNRQKIVLLWFGSWKNGVSTFAPTWVKSDQRRFPRVRVTSGSAIEMLSPFGEAALEADTRAYVALLEHLKRVDAQHTTLMIQLENEVGITGDSRDRSEAATRNFASPVPAELLQWLQQHRASLSPELLAAWQAAGARSTGTWQQVFGTDLRADEIFMAWRYAEYMGHLVRSSIRCLYLRTPGWPVPTMCPGTIPRAAPSH
jgi:beta-galactosidase GanA